MEKEENLNSKELCLVLLGAIESGKTSLISSLLGQTDSQPLTRTTNCIAYHGQLNGKRLTVIDTPGWYNGYPVIDTAQRTKDELVLSVRKCPPGPHAFILAIEVAGFTERNLRAVIEHLRLLGEDIWRHTIVVFTRGESLNKTIEEHIEDGESLKCLVEKCGNRYCVVDEKIAVQDQIIQLLEKIEALVDSNGGRHFQMDEETLRKVDERKKEAQQRARVRRHQVGENRKHMREQGPVVPADVSFLEEQRKITEDNMKRMFGEMAWKHTIVLFNWWDSLGNTSIEEHIESEGEPLRWLVEKCGNRYHALDIVNREDGLQVRELLQKIDELEASLEFCDLTQEAPNTEITPSYEAEDQIKPEMVELVEKEWHRRDRELEEKVRRFWQESFGSNDSQKDWNPWCK
ncbi:GTPase IMAP family member 7-like [Engraulis encrasicolus]|uniref:GTPase IMAP family member 7-like n=1 Tax=Engraulis encrasicolus TaxID=184585 RepID=UPI002FCE6B17